MAEAKRFSQLCGEVHNWPSREQRERSQENTEQADMEIQAWVAEYLGRQKSAIEAIPADLVAALAAMLQDAGRSGRRIFVCGNGGNAANASHFATDLGKGASDVAPQRFKVLSLADNVSWLTAIGNDYSFDDVFVRQLSNHAQKDDLLILSSVSGDSPNLVAAAEWGRDHGLKTVGLVGGRRGRLSGIVDRVVVIDDTHYGRVEDCQMMVLHMLCYAIIEGAVGP